MSKTATIDAGPALVPPREARRQLLCELRRKMLATAATPESRAQ